LVQAMERLGHPNFSVVGHDRGGRAAYRMALDHPDRVEALAVLDVIPTSDVWALANDRMALAFWPFSFLAQPAPFPETLAGAAPEAVIENVIQTWGSTPAAFPPWVRAAYVEALKDPRRVHAICEEYRAAAGVDRRDDLADQAAGRRIECPVLALWSGAGALNDWYADQGGPLGVWRRWAPGVTGEPVSGGHFFPEEHPVLTADALDRFLSSSVPAGEGR
jgi:haloacetate dehalogenase